MGMPPERICCLPLDTPTLLDGVEITLIDANHCPGAVMFLFRVPPKEGSARQVRVFTSGLLCQDVRISPWIPIVRPLHERKLSLKVDWAMENLLVLKGMLLEVKLSG